MKANIEAFYYRVRNKMDNHSRVRGMFLPEKYKTRNLRWLKSQVKPLQERIAKQ